MKILEWEAGARERASTTGTPAHTRKTQVWISTAATLLASNSGSGSGGPNCAYCGQGHTSTSCATITDVTARKEILRKTGRCNICLRKNTSAGIATCPPVAGRVGGDTTSASVPDGTRIQEGRTLLPHKGQELHPPLRLLQKAVTLRVPCMLVHRLLSCSRQQG